MNKVRKFVSYVMYVESGLTFVVLSVNVFFLAANESGPNSEVTVITMMLSSAPRFAVPFFTVSLPRFELYTYLLCIFSYRK